MKILLTANASYIPPRGGSTRSNHAWLKFLAARGHSCLVVAPAAATEPAELLEQGLDADATMLDGVTVHTVRDSSQTGAALLAQIREFQPDWVLVSSEDLGQQLLVIAERELPGHVVYLAHTPQMFPFGPASLSPNPGAMKLIEQAAAVVTIGEHMASYVREHAGRESVVVHPPIYGSTSYDPRPDGFVLIVNPCAVKGISVFLALAAEFPDFEFAALPGWGTTSQDRAALASLPNVRILKRCRDIGEVLSQTRILLTPSLWHEGFGLIVVEAMLRGIPVVSSKLGGLAEAKHGTGYVIPVRPIARYETRFDEQRMPVAQVPEQDMIPWIGALWELLNDRGAYENESRKSFDVAREFVSNVNGEAFEAFLVNLRKRDAPPMKILLAQNSLYFPAYGGGNKSNRILLESLVERGHSCRVVARASEESGPAEVSRFLHDLESRGVQVESSSAGVVVYHLNSVEVNAVTNTPMLRDYLTKQISRMQPDWTLVSTDDLAQLLLTAALECSRVVFLVRTTLALPFGPDSAFKSPEKTERLRRVAGIVTVTNYVADYVRRWGGMDAICLPISLLGSGPFVDFGCFDRGFVAMINPCATKGISIFAALALRFPDVPFAAVPTWGTTEEDLNTLRRIPNVHLLDPVDDMDDILRLTRVVLVPSLWAEARARIIGEAMARGIPVLASDVGGISEAKLGVDYLLPVRPIVRYESRLDSRMMPVPVVPEQDVEPWAHALSRVLSDRSHYDEISRKSRDAALAYVSSSGVEPFEEFLRSLGSGSVKTVVAAVAAGEAADTRVETLSPEKRALLALRVRKKRTQSGLKQTIPRRGQAAGEPLPLAFPQERMWRVQEANPGTCVYNVVHGYRLFGPLRAEALDRSLSEMARRHEILRTSFPVIDGRPAQVVHPAQPTVLRRDVLRAELVTEVVNRETLGPFDLAHEPALEARLFALGTDDHLLVLKLHHIAADGWSFGVFARELRLLYEGSTLPELPIQYGDFACWQREHAESDLMAAQLNYWRRQLAHLPEMSAETSFRGGRELLRSPAGLKDALHGLSRREGVTLFMTLLAAFVELLHRQTGREDVVIGTPIANRGRAELEPLIGMFVNLLVLRAKCPEGIRFRDLLAAVKEMTLQAFAHQDLPYGKLRDELNRGPLFRTLFVLQNMPSSPLELPGLTIQPIEVDNHTSEFDLRLSVTESADGLRSLFQYKTDVYDASTIAHLVSEWQALLEEIATGS